MKNQLTYLCLFLILVLSIAACDPILPRGTPAETAKPTVTPGQPDEPPVVEDTQSSTATSEQAINPTETLVETTMSPLPIFDAPIIRQITMFTPQQGWALTMDGNHILFTDDGGQTWLTVTPSDLVDLPQDYLSFGIQPFFLDESTAWFTPNTAGSGLLYHSQNSGIDWTIMSLPFNNARYHFLDLMAGYALVDLGAGAGSHYIAIYRTLDGGASWIQVFSHEPGSSKSLRESGTKNGLTFRDVDSGWIGGAIPMDDFFYLYYTQDGGETWSVETDILLPGTYTGSFLDVWQPLLISETSAYLPVMAASPDGMHLLIYLSEDDGESWVFQSAIQDGRMVDFINSNEGWIATSSELFRTMDGADTWTAVATPGIPAGMTFLDADFVNNQYGWLLVTPDESTMAIITLYRTTDGGTSWEALN